MTATTIAAQFAHTLGQHGFTATLHPAPTPNGYGHKIALATDTRVPLGHLVIYAGKQGSRYVTNELRSVSPLQLAAIATAWTTCGSSVPHATSPASATPPINAAASPNIELWVDGACLQESGNLRFGWAYVIRQDGTELARQTSSRILPYMTEHRNVAAELQAVIAGLEHCRQLGLTTVTIFFDYQGIESWGIGTWKANTRTTQEYQQYIRACPMALVWRKVTAHSGVPMNELVDSLANNAASVSDDYYLVI